MVPWRSAGTQGAAMHDFAAAKRQPRWSMIPKSGNRPSEKIMLEQRAKAG
jgi:hypothetical protein